MQSQATKKGLHGLHFKARVQNELLERTVFPLQRMIFGRAESLTGQREYLEGQFGLVPEWVTEARGGTKFGKHCYNAGSETIFEKPSFRQAILTKRALILVDAFYERADETSDNRQLKIIRKDGSYIALAGIWEYHPGYQLESCAIITTEPMDLLKGLHSRSPLVLDEGQVDAWLDPKMQRRGEIEAMLKVADSRELVVDG